MILGKNADRSGPLVPMVPAAEAGDLRDGLRVQTRVNGQVVQDASTEQMVQSVGDTLALIPRTIILRSGDLLATGTPSGVGYARKPPWLLQPGDTVEVEVERPGVLRNPIVAHSERASFAPLRMARLSRPIEVEGVERTPPDRRCRPARDGDGAARWSWVAERGSK